MKLTRDVYLISGLTILGSIGIWFLCDYLGGSGTGVKNGDPALMAWFMTGLWIILAVLILIIPSIRSNGHWVITVKQRDTLKATREAKITANHEYRVILERKRLPELYAAIGNGDDYTIAFLLGWPVETVRKYSGGFYDDC